MFFAHLVQLAIVLAILPFRARHDIVETVFPHALQPGRVEGQAGGRVLTTVRQGTSVIVMVSRTEALCHQVKTHEATNRAQLHTLPSSVRGLRLRSAVRSRQAAHWTRLAGSLLTARASLKLRQRQHRVRGRLRQLPRGGGIHASPLGSPPQNQAPELAHLRSGWQRVASSEI